MDEVYRLNYQGLTNLELLEHIRNQERDALATLYERFGRREFSLAVRILSDSVSAEEVTQDVFMSVWRRGGHICVKKGKVHDLAVFDRTQPDD